VAEGAAKDWERGYESSLASDKAARQERKRRAEIAQDEARRRFFHRPATWLNARIHLGRRARIAVQIALIIWWLGIYIFRPALEFVVFSALMLVGLGLLLLAEAFPPPGE